MRLSHDVWHQVIQYLEHERGDSDAPEKRTALLNLALTSRSLSSLALATLWKNMDSMMPIVNVINSFTPEQEEPFLTWIDDGAGCSYWEFSRKPDGHQVCLRVKEYFSRFRLFQAWGKSPSQRALWPILIAWFWKGEPLLPKLQKLFVYFDKDGPTSYHHLTLMVPPRLKLIATERMQSFGQVVDFYQHLVSQGCSPDEVEYIGDLRLPTTLKLFENLNSLVVEGPYKRERHSSPFSLVELLRHLPFLKWLEIDLGTLQIEPTGSPNPFEHPTLKNLILQGTTGELYPFLYSGITCPLVEGIALKIRFNRELTWKFLLGKVTTIFPNMDDLSFEVLEPSAATPRLVCSDLDELLPRPMESFTMEGVPNKLSRKDLQQMLEAWRGLNTLTVTGGKTSFNAEALLSASTYQNLHTLHLPFNFVPLAFPVAPAPAAQQNQLQHLYVAAPTIFPSTLKEKVILAQNLFALLPELKTVDVTDENLGAGATDLQDIIDGIQTMTATRSG